MKRFLISLLFLFTAVLAEAQSLESLLRTLDKVIDEKDTYANIKEKRIESYRLSAAKSSPDNLYVIYDALFNEYFKFNADSALNYALKKEEIALKKGDREAHERALLNIADIYIYAGMYPEAKNLVDRVSGRYAAYYHVQHTLCTALYQSSVFHEGIEMYKALKDSYRDSLIASLPSEDLGYTYAVSEKLIENGNYYEALLSLTDRYNNPSTPESAKAILDYSMAVSYMGLQNREKAEWHFANSAIADLQTSTKEYKSLQELARMLYEDGDISRAYRYISCAMEDMQSSNAKIRTAEFFPFFPAISDAYQNELNKANKLLTLSLAGLSVLLLLLILFFIVTFIQRSRLKKSNAEIEKSLTDLKEANMKLLNISDQLQEAGCIKEEYLYQYMEQSSGYIDQLESYRRKLLLIYRKGGEEKVAAELEKPFDVDIELKKFYANFDETFLHLFPNFVQDVNLLLKDDQQLVPKNDRQMNTELRILALMRLGVTDSVKMAHFLRTSISTIYNYRTKFRNSALSSRSDFEDKVASIGQIKI